MDDQDVSMAQSQVLHVLAQACSQDAAQLKLAEQQLKAWEIEPGFYSTLLSVFSNHSIDVNVRWLAVMYIKNGVDRYWRKSAPNAIHEDEKDQLRQHLLTSFNEPFPQVATQVSVLIAKIARLDCPRHWPALVPTLLESVRRDDDSLVQQRALLTLYHVTKTLASKRLGADRKLFQELTSGILTFIAHLWSHHLDRFLQLLAGEDAAAAGEALEMSTLALKVLRKLLVYGVRDFHTSDDAVCCVTAAFERLPTLLECRRRLAERRGGGGAAASCEKHVGLLMKLLIELQEQHPLSYGQLIGASLQCVVTYLFTEAGDGLLYERFTVQCLNVMKAIITCSEYRPAKVLSETKNQLTLRAHKAKMDFFTADTLVEICRRLLSRYFPLTETDLALWRDDPEGFAIDEGGEAWRFSLRPCTEVLFLALFREFKTTLTPVLLALVDAMRRPADPADLAFSLQKDAVYTAVGLASFELFDEIDFDAWFATTLLPELRIAAPEYKIIRRRVVWLIGQWVGVKMSVAQRPALYECLQPLLAGDDDLVVRVTAATTLKQAIDDFEFDVEQFVPYLESSFALLFALLRDVRECDTKMHVLHVLSFVIERCDARVRPYASTLLRYLPLLWDASAEHDLLRCAILTTLVNLVRGLGTSSEQLHGFLLPVVALATDTTARPHVYLLEDGLELWLATLRHAPRITAALMQLAANLRALIELGTEHLRTCFSLVQAYALLGPREFLAELAAPVARACDALYADVRPEGVVAILRVVELALRLFPRDGARAFAALIPRALASVVDYEDTPTVLSACLAVMSRLVLDGGDALGEAIAEVARRRAQTADAALRRALDVWTDRMGCVTQPERRKLCGLAAAALLAAPAGPARDKFADLVAIVVEVLNDVCCEEGGLQVDALVSPATTVVDDDDELDTEHDRRKRALSRADPEHTISLKEFAMAQLQSCRQTHGEEAFARMMAEVDAEVTTQLQEFFR
ncbi:PREDICTED: importin-11-like [Priapulus caudatus]|uniref:Importin-11-like n=1 Tax=Priapulus caudatus TaxID=37621 RepID=A0ABM1EIF5_PRICU|nr:PREDICTED: importin-11-like [Priapulus caudatus]